MNLVWWLVLPIIYVLTWICSWRPSTKIEVILLSFLFVIPLLVDFLGSSKTRVNPKARLALFYERVIETGILLLVAIVPWQLDTRANDAIFIKTVFTQIIVFTIAIMWFLKIIEEGSFSLAKAPINIPIMAFWIWCVVTFVTSQYKYVSLEELYRFVTYFLIFFIIINNIKERTQVWRIITTLMITSAIIAVYGIFQHFGYDFVSWASQARIPASLGNPDFYSGYLCVTIPIGAGLIFATKSTINRVSYVILTVLQLMGLFYTLTRGGLAAIPLAFVYLVFLKVYVTGFKNVLKNKTVIRASLIALAALCVGVLIFFTAKPLRPLRDRMVTTLTFGVDLIKEAPEFITYVKPFPQYPPPEWLEDGGNRELLSKAHIYRSKILGTAGVRVLIWTGAWRMFLERPFTWVFGQGLGTYRQAFPPHRPPCYRFKTVSHNTEHAHGEYFEILSEQGAVGIILFLWIAWVFFMKRSGPLHTPDRWKQNLLFGLMTGVFAILFENLGSVNLRWTSCAPFFWLTLALGIVVSRLPDRTDLNGITPVAAQMKNKPQEQQKQKAKPQAPPQPQQRAAQEKKKLLSPEIRVLAYIGSVVLLIFLCVQVIYPFLADINLRNGNLRRDAPQEWDMSIQTYNKALKYEPTNIEVPYKLAYIYAQKKMWNEALTTYRSIERLCPHYTQIHYNFGITYYNLGRIDEALKEFETTVKYDWSNDVGFFMLGVCYSAKKEWEKALWAFRCATVARQSTKKYLDEFLSPYYPAADLNIGNIYYRLGKLPEAATYYESVLRVDPGNGDAAMRLQWVKEGRVVKWE